MSKQQPISRIVCQSGKTDSGTEVTFTRWSFTDFANPRKPHIYQPGDDSLLRLKHTLPTRPYHVDIFSDYIAVNYDVRPYSGPKGDIIKILGELELVGCTDRYLPDGNVKRKFHGSPHWWSYASIIPDSGFTPEDVWITAQSDYKRWATEHPERALFVKKFHDLAGENGDTRDMLWNLLKLSDFDPDDTWNSLYDKDREAFTYNDLNDLCYLHKLMEAELIKSEGIRADYNNYLSFIRERKQGKKSVP
jgi:hypothetical protein